MRLPLVSLFVLLIALLTQVEWFSLLDLVQEGELLPSASSDAEDVKDAEESILNSRLGLIALMIFTVGGALLASQGKRFQAVNRFLRSGSVQE
jgi:hypothetical protein